MEAVRKFEDYIKDDVTVIQLNMNQATLTEAGRFRTFVIDFIEKGTSKIIVDLRKCSIIDSTFLGALVFSLKKITANNGNLRLVFNNNSQNNIFMLTGINKVFKIYPDLETAIQSFEN
ncbi:MAG: STAS domain-containing protein [Bacteroidetes bacterium]|nr:STAS domain-containing protein [Bacteroidota bacterium]